MTISKWDAALAACDELEALLANAYPAANPALLARVQKSVALLQGTGDPYVQMKAGMIGSRAAVYLSAHRHEKEQGGADGVMHDMRYSLLGRIRDQLRSRQQEA